MASRCFYPRGNTQVTDRVLDVIRSDYTKRIFYTTCVVAALCMPLLRLPLTDYCVTVPGAQV